MKKNRNEFTNDIVRDDMIDYLIEEEKRKVNENLKKQNIKEYIYHYEKFDKDKKYSLKEFSDTNKIYNNPNSLTNYERYAFNTYRIIIPKMFMQYLGVLETVYLEEISRFSISLDVNKYGFFTVSRKYIADDIGISPKIQDRLCKKLEKSGLITTYTFGGTNKRKFYRFNDDAVMNLYWKVYKHTYKRIKVKRDEF